MIYIRVFVPLALAVMASGQTPEATPATPAPAARARRAARAPVAAPVPLPMEFDQLAAPTPRPALAPMASEWPQATPRPMLRPALAPNPPGALFQIAPSPRPAVAPQPFDFDFQFDFDMPELPDMVQLNEQIEESRRAMMYADREMLLAQNFQARGRYQGDDRLYESGLSALDNHRYDSALESFSQVTARAGSHADAGWYWKAYTLNKLGRREEALSALAQLRQANPNSRWLDDAKALELEVKQQSGKPVSPEGEADEDLKLMALNSLMQSDPERALPLVDKVLKGSNSPRVKQRALYVLAVSNSPRAQQILAQVARGGSNPDLQLKAINYLGTMRRRQGNTAGTAAILSEIYGSSNDPNVKRAILNSYMSNRDIAHLNEVARNEKDPELRKMAFVFLGNNTGQPELWQIYQAETSNEVKEQILGCMYRNGNADKLAQVARTEKDPKLRRLALRVLASQRTPATGASLMSLYTAEQDEQAKKEIVNSLREQNNAKALVDLAKGEKDSKMKLFIVERLSNLKSKEATDYLEELLTR